MGAELGLSRSYLLATFHSFLNYLVLLDPPNEVRRTRASFLNEMGARLSAHDGQLLSVNSSMLRLVLDVLNGRDRTPVLQSEVVGGHTLKELSSTAWCIGGLAHARSLVLGLP